MQVMLDIYCSVTNHILYPSETYYHHDEESGQTDVYCLCHNEIVKYSFNLQDNQDNPQWLYNQ